MALPDSVTVLEKNGTTYYLVGTAHVSERSVEEVRALIDEVEPDIVCVELDSGRHDALTKDSAFRDLDVFKVIKEGKTLYLLAHLALGAYQRRMGAALGVKPGSEMLAAIDAAKAKGSKVELVDRDINLTLRRTWKSLGVWKRATLLTSLVFPAKADDDDEPEEITAETVEKLKETKALSEMLDELSRALPEVKRPLIDERDAYMISKIEEAGVGAKKVVAVVGAAHVPGMKARFGTTIDRDELTRPPKPSLVWTAIKYLIPALILGLLTWAAFRFDTSKLGHMAMAWIIPTSGLAALFTIGSAGRPLTVLTAIVMAPICALTAPILHCAFFTGVVETWLRKPTVKDCERLSSDVETLRGFWRNPVTHILIVATASSVGTSIGRWIGVAWVATLW
ncbi:MAG TPA: TraB/GumN family protein [Kofleriaceae bacterium]|jgi:pheromone shutdown-related protein TraB|nr:TraB/GumN family protein [Kofleriaceae bacterium]